MDGALSGQRDLLADVLNTLVPAADGFPAAGDVALDHVLAMASSSAELDALLAEAIRAVHDASRAGGFSALGADEREAVLGAVERARPDLFAALLRQTYDGYYSHPAVVSRLGLDPGPVHPRGHRIESTTHPELSRVAARGPLYRPTRPPAP